MGFANSHFYKDEDGNILGVERVVRDVTDRVRAEEELARHHEQLEQLVAERTTALKTSERRFADFAEVAADWFWETNAQHRFIILSKQTREPLDFGSTQLLGKKPWELRHPDEFAQVEKWAQFQADFEARRPIRNFEYRIHPDLADGGWRSVNSKPVFAEDGSFLGYRGSARDITGRKQLEAQLVQSAKLSSLGEMAAGIAHEINTPHATVILSVYNALDALKRGKKSEVRETLKLVERQTEYMAAVIQQMLSFSRDAQHDEEEVVNLNDAVKTVLSIQAKRLEQDEIKIRHVRSRKTPLVYGRRVQLEQVCYNLLQNAAQAVYGQDEQTIVFQTRVRGQRAQLEVRDSGIGIPPSLQQQVFEPFFTTKSRHMGTGLGLSVSLRIAEQHHGRLRLRSRPGKGTTFLLDLPLHSRKRRSAAQELDG